MKKILLATILGLTVSVSAHAYEATDKNCSVSFINKVAQYEGLAKATSLSKACIAKGYNAAKDWSVEKAEKAWDATKDGGSTVADKTADWADAAKDKAAGWADKALDKGAELKKKYLQ